MTKTELQQHTERKFLALNLPGWSIAHESVSSGAQAGVCVVVRDDSVKGVFRCLPPGADSISNRRFIREIEALKGINHPNILRPIQFGTSDDPWYISELGVPFKRYWSEFTKRSNTLQIEQQALLIVKSLASGLAACHAHGLVHRDIKPNNVVIYERDGAAVPVLIDFGVVWVQGAEPLTEDGHAVGNARYAPDILRQRADECPPWVDVFELVQMFQWMIAERDGKHYWQRPTHWRYLAYPEDSSAWFVGALAALGAAASSELSCPANGAALGKMIDALFAAAGASVTHATAGALPTDVQEAIAFGRRESVVREVTDREVVEASKEVASFVLNPLVSELRALTSPTNITVTVARTFGELFDAELRLREPRLLELRCAVEGAGAFLVTMHVHDMVPSRWPNGGKPKLLEGANAFTFSIHRAAEGAGTDFPYEEIYFALGRDAQILLCSKGWTEIVDVLTIQQVVQVVKGALYHPDAWRCIAKVAPR